MSYEGWLPRCIICKQSVNLEQSKTDEHGRPVHENCYVSLLSSQNRPRFLARAAVPKQERLSLWTLLMSAGWN
jgi:hypothetical protein